MDKVSLGIAAVSLVCNCALSFAVYYTVKAYKAKQDKLYEEYLREAETMDNLAGLLEVLFDINNPKERAVCAKCGNIYSCLEKKIMPTYQNVCVYFSRREK